MPSCAPAASATDGTRTAAAMIFTRCFVTGIAFRLPKRVSSLLALLSHRPALELELDVAELDDVVVDQVVLLDLLVVDETAVRAVQVRNLELAPLVADGGVLARELFVGEHHVAVGGGADHVLADPQAKVLALVLPVERHQPAADFAALVGGAAALVAAAAHVAKVDHRRALAHGGRHRHASAAAAGHHRLLHLQAIRALIPAGVHDVPV